MTCLNSDKEENNNEFSILQNILLPTIDHFKIHGLLTRWSKGHGRLASDNGLEVAHGEVTSFNTYYNGFSYKKWQDVTGLESVGLQLEGTGKAKVNIYLQCDGEIRITLLTTVLDLSFPEIIWINEIGTYSTQSIYFDISPADSELIALKSGGWVTNHRPINEINLLVVMTTFRREIEATRAYLRFKNDVIPNTSNVSLLIVDNGVTLNLEDTESIRVINNKNLGGAGGFTRGLLEAKSDGRFTHVIFMDDDANCLSEAIYRTKKLLQFSKIDRMAVAGAMFLEENPVIQYERSGELILSEDIRGYWSGHGSWRDLTSWSECVRNDTETNGNYGGWWFFAFAIKDIEKLPFPFFVRGDDTDFSIANDLNIMTLNGISTICPDLGSKNGYTTTYLSERSWIALNFLHGTEDRCLKVLSGFLKKARNHVQNWDYGRAQSVLLAIEDALQGPEFFDENPSAIGRFKVISDYAPPRLLTFEEHKRIATSKYRKGIAQYLDRPTQGNRSLDDMPIILVPAGAEPRRYASQGSILKAHRTEEGLALLKRDPSLEEDLLKRISLLYKSRRAIAKRTSIKYRSSQDRVRSEAAWLKRLDLE